MSFDRNKAQLSSQQLDVASAIDQVYEAIRQELNDEDPGVIDGDDILQIVLASAGGALTTIVQAIGTNGQSGAIGLGNLFVGAGAAFFNDNVDSFAQPS